MNLTTGGLFGYSSANFICNLKVPPSQGVSSGLAHEERERTARAEEREGDVSKDEPVGDSPSLDRCSAVVPHRIVLSPPRSLIRSPRTRAGRLWSKGAGAKTNRPGVPSYARARARGNRLHLFSCLSSMSLESALATEVR